MDYEFAARMMTPEGCTPGSFIYLTSERIFGVKLTKGENEKPHKTFLLFSNEQARVRAAIASDLVLQFDDARLIPDYASAIHTSCIKAHLPFGSLLLPQPLPDRPDKMVWIADREHHMAFIQVEDGAFAPDTTLHGIYIVKWKVVLPSREDEVLFEFTADLPDGAGA